MSTDAKGTFFRQSGWMFLSTLASGIFMFAIHPVYGPYLGEKTYGEYTAILSILSVMIIPSLGLQSVFAQQGAAAVSSEEKDLVAATLKTLLRWTFFLWLGMALVITLFHRQIVERLHLPGDIALALTVAIGLGQLWWPIFMGVMQGEQRFLWLGWSNIFSGVGRFFGIGLFVVLLQGGANGAAMGVFVGLSAAVFITAWKTRDVWGSSVSRKLFRPQAWLKRVIPLTLGLGASQFIFTVDYLIIRDLFGENQTGSYSFAGTVGRGIILFTAPLSLVMFPKVVQSASQQKKSNVLAYTFISTLSLGALAAAACSLAMFLVKQIIVANATYGLPPVVIAKLQANKPALLVVTQLLPWFVWGMLPLATGNVLLNNLMARRRFRVVWYVVALAGIYALTLYACGRTLQKEAIEVAFLRFVQTLTLFNLIFLALVTGFAWKDEATPPV